MYIDSSRNTVMSNADLWEVFLLSQEDDDYYPAYTGPKAECLNFMSKLPASEQETAFAESGLDRVSVY